MTQAQPSPETPATYGLTPQELCRLNSAYAAIRKPEIRAELLDLLEAWSKDQWECNDPRY